MPAMKQAELGMNLSSKRTRNREFIGETNRVAPWAALIKLITLHALSRTRGRRAIPLKVMIRLHFMRQPST
jgi:IS5 family transposase